MREVCRSGKDRNIGSDDFFLEKCTYVEMNKILSYLLICVNYEILF